MDGKKVSTLDIPEINSFLNVIECAIDTVKNAVLLSYSNGLAEGSVNELKI